MSKQSTTLIYGTNLSGYRIAYSLGKLGYKTVMLNRGAYVDEIKNQVLSQLPMDLCWACGHMPQRMFIGLGAMQVFYNSEMLAVSGEAGNFKVKVKKRDPYVNNFACTECDKCIEACPVDVEQNGLKRKACYVHEEMAWENIYLIDEENCTKCGECEKVCPTGALTLDRPVEEIEIDAGAIVLAPEFDEPNEEDLALFGWKTIPNVVKSADIARAFLSTNIISDAFKRPSDGKLIKKVAIIITPQFNTPGKEYESFNASAQAVYRANKIKEMIPEAEVSLFCRDYKCFGKGHCRMYERAENNGINIIRTDNISVSAAPDESNTISYTLGNKELNQTVDMTILIFGQKAPQQMKNLADLCGVQADDHGFCKIAPFSCSKTSVDGIFAVGEFTAPKGNPETIWEGYGPIREVLKHLGEKNVEPPKPPSLRNVSKEIHNIGVFICSCFGTFEDKINLDSLVSRVKALPNVGHVEVIEGCCTPPSISATAEKIKKSGVNRAVLAVCTPIQKLMKFRKTVMMAGLNPLLTEFVRFKEDVVFVHKDPAGMERKAAALISSATARLKRSIALPPPMDSIGSRSLIIGGGLTGMEAARCLAERGFSVDLVEKTDKLGGMAEKIGTDLEGNDFRAYMQKLLKYVNESDLIAIHKNTGIARVSGYAGNFCVYTETADGENHELKPAVVFIATGALENKPNIYGYGEDKKVMTQLELTQRINKGESVKEHVAMIQCVGSRNEAMPYCSRVCCSHALKNALLLKEQGVDVSIFYRDMNTYGFKEDYYKKAIEKGIKFIRFDKNNYPKCANKKGKLNISYNEYGIDKEDTLSADYLILSVGILPDKKSNESLSKMFNIDLDVDGFYDTESCACPYEDAAKRMMKPFELSSNGVFPIGLVHSPRSLSESLLMARQATGKALIFLSKAKMPPPNAMYVSEVDAGKCAGCGLCVTVCPYKARSLDPVTKTAIVHPFLCDSCGACVVACPSGASFLRDHREEQMISSIDALLAA